MAKPYIIRTSGAFLRRHDGGVEGVAEVKAAGFSWLALNLGDDQVWEDWRTVITRARALGMQVFPWRRCRTIAECEALLVVAAEMGNRACLNLENELETTCPPDKVREVIRMFPSVAVFFSMNGWLPNDVIFAPIATRPTLLQVFPTDMHRDPVDLPQITADCVKHAHEKGFRWVGVTCQAYSGAKPEWYSYLEGPKSIYAGDDVGAGNWAAWA